MQKIDTGLYVHKKTLVYMNTKWELLQENYIKAGQ